MGGGVSRPMKSFLLFSESPASAPINAPDNNVPIPETPLAPMRGRTTQKRESSVANDLAEASRSMVVSTWLRSSAKAIDVTLPITTFLYLTWVLLTSSPSAVRKLTVICGPACLALCTTIDNPISAATIGTSHTSDTLKRRRLTSGLPGTDVSVELG